MSRESAWNPGVLVSPVPDGNTDAVLGLNTGADGVAVVGGLLGELRIGRGQVHTNVKFRDGNLNSVGSVTGHDLLLVVLAGGAADDEVSLETNSVDLGTVGLNKLDNSSGTGGLGAGVLNVVIIVVEFDSRVHTSSSGKGDGEVGRADGVIPNTLAI